MVPKAPHQNFPKSWPSKCFGKPSKCFGQPSKCFGQPSKCFGHPSKCFGHPSKCFRHLPSVSGTLFRAPLELFQAASFTCFCCRLCIVTYVYIFHCIENAFAYVYVFLCIQVDENHNPGHILRTLNTNTDAQQNRCEYIRTQMHASNHLSLIDEPKHFLKHTSINFCNAFRALRLLQATPGR